MNVSLLKNRFKNQKKLLILPQKLRFCNIYSFFWMIAELDL